MNIRLFFGLLVGVATLSLWLGKRASSGQKNNEDYFLMGRKLGLFALFMTLLATQVGGGALIGAAEEAYAKGWTVLFYPLGMVLGLLVLGCGYGAKMRRLNLTTVPEIFDKIYRAPNLRQIASLLSIASLYFILVAQAIAARKFFFSLGFAGPYLFVGFWIVLTLYTVLGGLKAVVSTDILQALFIL
nr:sodium:solute symporter family protein [Gammaproteobacteria bacterium]